MSERRIAVAMSGGVDSSVAAALLAAQGEQVFGVMMRLWVASAQDSNRCCSPADVESARQVAAALGIPFYVIDARQPFKQHVVDGFISSTLAGLTPNPCLICNRDMRWTFLRTQVMAMGATHLATGHYARLQRKGDCQQLLRARDGRKDQSYMLALLTQSQLRHTIFPLARKTKPQVRAIARRLRLPVSERGESQDLCFVGSQDYRAFLRSEGVSLPPPGPIVDMEGRHLGTHSGLADYTIGQRKGISASAAGPWYVVAKDLASNTLVVGPRDASKSTRLQVTGVNWICGQTPQRPLRAKVRVRYKGPEVPATLMPRSETSVDIVLRRPLFAVTPGQAAVFYQGACCLGGGTII
jgi:tRNA-specific 2-thiouridylase